MPVPVLYQVRPRAAGPDCAVCRGPVRPGYARCYQCEHHDLLGPGLLADAVVPISYAVKGTALAADLWRYKSGPEPGAPARASLQALLLAFLRDHGACVWRQAAMPPPTHLAVVPTGCGRPGPHPLLRLVGPHLGLPLAPLAIRPGRQGRDLDPDRFLAGRLPGRRRRAAAGGQLGIGGQCPVGRRRAQAGRRWPGGDRGGGTAPQPGRSAYGSAGGQADLRALRSVRLRRASTRTGGSRQLNGANLSGNRLD